MSPTHRGKVFAFWYRRAPEGVEIIPTFIGFRASDKKTFESAFERAEQLAADLKSAGCDIIVVSGSPPVLLKGLDFEREWRDRLSQKLGVPVVTQMEPHALAMQAMGIYPRASALEMDVALWEQVLRVNLGGTFLCARTVAKFMIEAGRGAIVNTASGRALAGAARGAHYASSKAGIVALIKSLALEWAPYGIRVNCVIPGITDTAQPRGEMSDEQLYRVGSSIPLGRIGRPEDIAAVVAFLLGGDASYMTGQSVAVNGGAIMIP